MYRTRFAQERHAVCLNAHSISYLTRFAHGVIGPETRYPHMKSVRNCFIRGSVVRYVQLPPEAVDVDILHDATRREARGS